MAGARVRSMRLFERPSRLRLETPTRRTGFYRELFCRRFFAPHFSFFSPGSVAPPPGGWCGMGCPVVVASSVIPAYAASDEGRRVHRTHEDSTMITAGDGVKKVAVLTVPAGAKRMRFVAVVPVARTTLWLMPVPVPWWRFYGCARRQTITLTAGSGGIGNGELKPAEGGDGSVWAAPRRLLRRFRERCFCD